MAGSALAKSWRRCSPPCRSPPTSCGSLFSVQTGSRVSSPLCLILTPTLTDTAIKPLYCANCCKMPNLSVKAAWGRTARSTLRAGKASAWSTYRAHALTLLVHRCGWLALIALVTLLTALLILAFRRCRRQESMLARLVSYSVLLSFTTQAAAYLCCDLTLIPISGGVAFRFSPLASRRSCSTCYSSVFCSPRCASAASCAIRILLLGRCGPDGAYT